jgi:hypothetical protein
MINKYEPLKKLAEGVTRETLHGTIPTKTTMELAIGILALIEELDHALYELDLYQKISEDLANPVNENANNF